MPIQIVCRQLPLLFGFLVHIASFQLQPAAAQGAPAQTIKSFPAPDMALKDAKHKEPKSGVQLQGNQLTIKAGVGTPTTINSLSFSADGVILAAGKAFGRVVIWNVTQKKFVRALDTAQGIVDAVAVSPDEDYSHRWPW